MISQDERTSLDLIRRTLNFQPYQAMKHLIFPVSFCHIFFYPLSRSNKKVVHVFLSLKNHPLYYIDTMHLLIGIWMKYQIHLFYFYMQCSFTVIDGIPACVADKLISPFTEFQLNLYKYK